MLKSQTNYPDFTSLTCDACDGLGFITKDDAWKPEPCDCMKDAPQIVEPYKKD